MLNLVERRLATIRPEEAARLLDQRNTYCGQRPRRQSHVDFLARKMKEGLFLNAEISYASLPDGSWALTNGAHTLLCGAPHKRVYADFRIMRTHYDISLKAA